MTNPSSLIIVEGGELSVLRLMELRLSEPMRMVCLNRRLVVRLGPGLSGCGELAVSFGSGLSGSGGLDVNLGSRLSGSGELGVIVGSGLSGSGELGGLLAV